MLMDTSKPIEVTVHKDINIYVFKKGNGSIAAVWTPLKDPVRIQVGMPKDVTGYDLMGNVIPNLVKNRDSLIITNSPIFLTSGLSNTGFASKLSKAECFLPEVRADARLRSTDTADLYLSNLTSHALGVNVQLPSAWKKRQMHATIPANGSLVLPIHAAGDFLPGKKTNVSCKIVTSGNSVTTINKDIITYPAKRATEKVVVDGDLSEYRDIAPIVMDSPKWIYPSGGDAVANKLWAGPDDLSMRVWLTWDESNFYFAARVKYGRFIQDSEGPSIWNGDGFQIAFDTESDAVASYVSGAGGGYGDDDYEYGLALTKSGPQGFCWHAASKNSTMAGRLTDFAPVIKRVDEHTLNYEWAIPWSNLYPLKPVPGKAFGFNLSHPLHPNKPGEVYKYWMGLGMGITGGEKNPCIFPTFFLTR